MKQRIGWRALARYLAGESPPEERSAIQHWADADPRHRELLQSSRRAWDSVGAEPAEWDVAAGWRDVARRLEPPTAPAQVARDRAPRRPGARVWAWAVAAAAVVVVALPMLRGLRGAGAEETFATGAGERITVRLADGSVARLAPNTRLRVARDDAREVWLEGTAFFGVAEQDGQPFVVHTPAGQARVLGTRFELRVERDQVRLAVLEGRVELTLPGGQEVVEAGHVSLTRAGDTPSSPRPADVQGMVDWMGNVLIFTDTPLRQVAREIERLYQVPVRITDPELEQRTITATFEAQTLATVMATVCRVLDAECQVQETAVVVTS